jgi:hypothetical protein
MRKHLTYINGLGPDYKGDNLYEFIFSSNTDVWGDSWESSPANSYPSPPSLEHINKVGVLRKSNIKLELVQNSDYFCMSDAMDGVVALGWEIEDYEENKRLVFKFGEEEKTVKDKLYEKDLILEFEKNVVYEN